MNIVLLNGPPRSGKDTIGKLLAMQVRNSKILKFAHPLKNACSAIYCSNNEYIWNKYDSPELKDEPREMFFGKTCREVQISLSERYLKLIHGQRVFGEILAGTIARRAEKFPLEFDRTYVVTDSGFLPEAQVLVEKFGAERILLLRLRREGCDFSKDSRGYLDPPALGVECHDIDNNGDIYATMAEVQAIYRKKYGEGK